MRRCALLLLVLLAALAAPSHADQRTTPPRLDVATSATRIATPLHATATAAPARSGRSRARAHRDRRPARTVRGALRRALLAGHVTRREHDTWRRRWRDAERLSRRLPGHRAAELRGALAGVEDLARRGRLSAGRLPVAFLTVRRNAFAWSERPVPSAGRRTTFGRDPVVWQHYPGRGWQIQALATAGRANALARVCLEARERERAGTRAKRRPKARCRPAALGRIVDRLVDLSSRRGSFTAWELPFAFGGARSGWISGMTQATAIQALVRGGSALRRPELRRVARSALGAFEHRAPLGVARPAPSGGRFYVLYSDLPHLRVLNGHLQALIGLREAAMRGLGPRAGRAFRRGQRAARGEVPAADTGAWSLYSNGGRESDLGYHRLVGGFLRDLCRSTGRGLFCGAGKRFARYEREKPRVGLEPLHGLRAGRPARVAFRLSKVSTVRVTVAGGRGVALDRRARLGRGTHTFAFRPQRRGTYRVRVLAAGLSGPRTAAARDVVVRPAPQKKRGAGRRGRAPRPVAQRTSRD